MMTDMKIIWEYKWEYMNDVWLFGWLLPPGIHYDTNCNVYLPLLRRHPTYKTKTIPVYRDTTHFLPFSTTYRLLTGSLVGFCVTFLLKQVIHRSNIFKIEGVDTPRSCSLDRPLVVHIVARTGAIHLRICVTTWELTRLPVQSFLDSCSTLFVSW